MRSSRSNFLAAAAMAAGLGVIATAPAVPPTAQTDGASTSTRAGTSTAGAKTAQQLRQAELRETAAWSIFGRGGWSLPRYPRQGWSVRQGQRAALKRRNRRRHRAACRG